MRDHRNETCRRKTSNSQEYFQINQKIEINLNKPTGQKFINKYLQKNASENLQRFLSETELSDPIKFSVKLSLQQIEIHKPYHVHGLQPLYFDLKYGKPKSNCT